MAKRPPTPTSPAHNPIPGMAGVFVTESRIQFRHGYAEVRRYRWPERLESVVTMADDIIVLNMALSARPTSIQLTNPARPGQRDSSRAGRLLVMMPGSRVRLDMPTGELRSLHCALHRARIEEILGHSVTEGEHSTIELNGACGEIEWLLNRLYHECRHGGLGQTLALEAYGDALCVELARHIKNTQADREAACSGGLAPWRMRLLRQRIVEETPFPTQAELAQLCAMTVRHLSRAFKIETGKTLGQFIQEATIERAHRLLSETELPIADIAVALGYASAASFSQAFRKATGVTPSLVRKR